MAAAALTQFPRTSSHILPNLLFNGSRGAEAKLSNPRDLFRYEQAHGPLISEVYFTNVHLNLVYLPENSSKIQNSRNKEITPESKAWLRDLGNKSWFGFINVNYLSPEKHHIGVNTLGEIYPHALVYSGTRCHVFMCRHKFCRMMDRV